LKVTALFGKIVFHSSGTIHTLFNVAPYSQYDLQH
jgi:hypothetical protein